MGRYSNEPWLPGGRSGAVSRIRPWVYSAVGSLPRGLVVLDRVISTSGWEGHLRVEPEGAVLEGHFPGNPVLPGVAHLGLALGAAGDVAGRPLFLREVRALRLRRRVGPGAVLEAHVSAPDPDGVVTFEVRTDGSLAASGTVVVAEVQGG